MARRRTGFQKKIEVVHWTYGSFSALGLGSGVTVGVNVFPAQHLPETLLRIRGEWAAVFDGALVPSRSSSIAAGLILVPEGTDTTVLWSPITDGDAPWIWWDTFSLIYEEFVVDTIASTEAASGRRVIDSKAMRKVRNMELQFVAEQAGIEGTLAINVFGSIRALSGS